MSRGTAYYDLPNGERIELPTTMPDVEEVPGPLCDGKFELPEAVKEMFKWMDETFGTWESDFSSFKIWMKLRKNFNPPVRWEAMQDKRRNPKPLGRNTYLYKARKIKSLARSTHTRVSLHKGKQKGTEEQCKHTFKITTAPVRDLAVVTTWSASTTRKTVPLIQSMVLLEREISSPAPQKRGCFYMAHGAFSRH